MDTTTPLTIDAIAPSTIDILFMEKVSTCILSIAMAFFFWCISRSIQMLRHNRQPIYWFCLFANLLGPVRELAFLLPLLHVQVDCRIVSFVTNYAHEFSLDCIMCILLIKATVSNRHHKIIYIIGAICLIASLGLHTWHATTAVYTKSIFGACGNIPDPLIAILWFGCLWTLNTFLSGCFLIVIYSHHRTNHSPIYKSFLKDGMYFFLLITASNIITPCLVAKTVLGDNSSILFDIDWALQCTLITLQLSHSIQIRKGQSSFSHSLSVPPSSQNGFNFKSISSSQNNNNTLEHGKSEPWEGYEELSLEFLTQDKSNIVNNPSISSQRRSVDPLTMHETSTPENTSSLNPES